MCDYFMRSDNVALAGTSSAGDVMFLAAHARPKRNYMGCELRNWELVLEIEKLVLERGAGRSRSSALRKLVLCLVFTSHCGIGPLSG